MSEKEILKQLADHIEANIEFFEGDDFEDGVGCNGCGQEYDGDLPFCGECWQRIADACRESTEAKP